MHEYLNILAFCNDKIIQILRNNFLISTIGKKMRYILIYSLKSSKMALIFSLIIKNNPKIANVHSKIIQK